MLAKKKEKIPAERTFMWGFGECRGQRIHVILLGSEEKKK